MYKYRYIIQLTTWIHWYSVGDLAFYSFVATWCIFISKAIGWYSKTQLKVGTGSLHREPLLPLFFPSFYFHILVSTRLPWIWRLACTGSWSRLRRIGLVLTTGRIQVYTKIGNREFGSKHFRETGACWKSCIQI